MHAVRSWQLANRAPLPHMRLDQVPRLVHEKTPSRRCLLCPGTCVAYVVGSHTFIRSLRTRDRCVRFGDLGSARRDGRELHADASRSPRQAATRRRHRLRVVNAPACGS
jgi:hypothetical protein